MDSKRNSYWGCKQKLVLWTWLMQTSTVMQKRVSHTRKMESSLHWVFRIFVLCPHSCSIVVCETQESTASTPSVPQRHLVSKSSSEVPVLAYAQLLWHGPAGLCREHALAQLTMRQWLVIVCDSSMFLCRCLAATGDLGRKTR